MDLLKALIVVSEKAANVARLIRQDQHLFDLLVQQKQGDEANPRFVDDFKTLADVLIQEMVKHDIGLQFPEIKDQIKGEETNSFQNKLNESITVEIKSTESETSSLLRTVLNGDQEAADLLAKEVHRTVDLNSVPTSLEGIKPFDVDLPDLGVWIDPIDCTAEYIHGQENVPDASKISRNGLDCVTVLIGVFQQSTQLPVMGIVNQPFIKKMQSSNQWSGSCVWSYSPNTTSQIPSGKPQESSMKICVSGSESDVILTKLKEADCQLVEASGAGYKILSVITGLADAYILSKDSTYKWDTCAPQAILRALGGDVVVFREAVSNRFCPVEYPSGDGLKPCNFGGIIAFRDKDVYEKCVKLLSSC